MFRQFDNIQIEENRIKITEVDSPKEVVIEYSKPVDWLCEEHLNWYGTLGETCFLGGRWLIVRKKDENNVLKEFKIYMHKEVRYNINKSLRGNGLFDLNYRKHLRSKFSRAHMDVYFMDGIDDELKDDEEFNTAVKEIRIMAEEFSSGVEEKPIVVIAPSWDAEKYTLSYIIIKDEKIVKRGSF